MALDDINTVRISNEQENRYAEVPKPYAVVINIVIIMSNRCVAITLIVFFLFTFVKKVDIYEIFG